MHGIRPRNHVMSPHVQHTGQVNMGTLANRLDKLDNKFTVIEREVDRECSEHLIAASFCRSNQTYILKVATIAAMTEDFVHNTVRIHCLVKVRCRRKRSLHWYRC